MRLTVRTDLALRVLMTCAANPQQLLRTFDIAERCQASSNHLFQVVNLLQVNGFIATRRGRAGGLALAHPAERISVGAVVRQFESQPLAECFGDSGQHLCPLQGDCRLRGYLRRALEAFYHELDMVTLADLMQGNCGLATLLDIGPTPVVCDGAMVPPQAPIQ